MILAKLLGWTIKTWFFLVGHKKIDHWTFYGRPTASTGWSDLGISEDQWSPGGAGGRKEKPTSYCRKQPGEALLSQPPLWPWKLREWLPNASSVCVSHTQDGEFQKKASIGLSLGHTPIFFARGTFTGRTWFPRLWGRCGPSELPSQRHSLHHGNGNRSGESQVLSGRWRETGPPTSTSLSVLV